MTIKEKTEKAQAYGISIDEILKTDNTGIYGYFFIDENGNERCFYVGKATSFYYRTFDSGNGHIHKYIQFKKTNGKKYSKDLVVQLMDLFVMKNYKIRCRCLELVDYYDTSFSRAAHRLAFAELYWITKYQNMGECLSQMPEGVGSKEENYWKRKYSI